MSRTIKGKKGPGFEYWKSRLHPMGEVPGRFTKKQTAKKERRQGRHECLKAMERSGAPKN